MESEEKEYRRNVDSLSNGSPRRGNISGSNYDNNSGETHADKKVNVNGAFLNFPF